MMPWAVPHAYGKCSEDWTAFVSSKMIAHLLADEGGAHLNEPETTTVIAGDGSATVAEAAKRPKARSAPKWETEARDRLKTASAATAGHWPTWWLVTPTKATPGYSSLTFSVTGWASTSTPT